MLQKRNVYVLSLIFKFHNKLKFNGFSFLIFAISICLSNRYLIVFYLLQFSNFRLCCDVLEEFTV